MINMNEQGPLRGVTVIEFGNFIAGPYLTRLLADLGAGEDFLLKSKYLAEGITFENGEVKPREISLFGGLRRHGIKNVSP